MNESMLLSHVLSQKFVTKHSTIQNFTEFQATGHNIKDSANLQTHFSVYEKLLLNSTDQHVLNFNTSVLDNLLWVSLRLHSWQSQTSQFLTRPEHVLMLCLCFLALAINLISIVAIYHIQHLTTHLKLILSLGTADIFIIVSILLRMIDKIFNSVMNMNVTIPSERLTGACIEAVINSVTIFAFLISLLNLLAMAVDHYIAIIKPFYYIHLMSKKKAFIIIASMWSTAAIGGFSNFILGFPGFHLKRDLFNYCEFIMFNRFHGEYLVFGVTLLCLCIIVFIYLRIYFEVKKIHRQTPSFPHETIHNKKAMVTTLLIIGTYSICWLPNCMFQIYMIIQIYFDQNHVYKLFSSYIIVSKYLYILLLTNCIFDPIIYAARLKIVQMGYRNFSRKMTQKYRIMMTSGFFKRYTGRSSQRRTTINSQSEAKSLLKNSSIVSELMKSDDTQEIELCQLP